MSDDDNVTPLTLGSASQARMAARKNLKEEDETLETFIAIEFYTDDQPTITHNTASIERLLYAAEVLRQYALGGVSSTPEPRG